MMTTAPNNGTVPVFTFSGGIPAALLSRHAHSAFVRRAAAQGGLLTVLHTPVGRITRRENAAGETEKPYLQVPRDAVRLHSFLKDIEYDTDPRAEAPVWHLGLLPAHELRTLWGADDRLYKTAPQELESCERKRA